MDNDVYYAYYIKLDNNKKKKKNIDIIYLIINYQYH